MIFRKLRSPPLGGAIPSAVSREEEDTLEQRDGSGNKSECRAFFFFLACHVTYENAATTQHRSVSV